MLLTLRSCRMTWLEVDGWQCCQFGKHGETTRITERTRQLKKVEGACTGQGTTSLDYLHCLHPPFSILFPKTRLTSIRMQYFTATVALLSTSLLVSAAPTGSLQQRSCSVAYPQNIGFPIHYDIRQDSHGANKVTDTITFSSIPAGAYGCQLEVNFPAG